jgi:H+/Cl- antiporter ClcA
VMSRIGRRLRDRYARRLRIVREADGFESSRFLAKWVVLAVLIGAVAGLGAIAFYEAIRFVGTHVLGTAAGVQPPEPLGEGGDTTIRPFGRPWLVPLITTLGGLASGILVFTLAPVPAHYPSGDDAGTLGSRLPEDPLDGVLGQDTPAWR